MAYNRQILMTVGINNLLALDISELNITFDITRSSKIEDNSASFTIYNAKMDTREKILIKDIIRH